ncbi:MAG: hypothetical protein AAGA21_22130 [Pseudomonadota bacterium]
MARSTAKKDVSTPTAERISSLLSQIDRSGEKPADITDRPGEFLREFYETWYVNGGLEGGKPRNSIRRMRNEWLVEENSVRSLHPKLTGQVKVGRRDGQRLIDLFLSRWLYVGSKRKDEAVTEDGYVPYPSIDLPALTANLVDAVFGLESSVILLPKPSKEEIAEDDSITASVRSYKSLIEESDALITVSSRQSVLGPSPSEGMRLWWNLIDDLATNDVLKEKLFIWVLDIGSRQVEDEGSFADFLNAGTLALHFSALANFLSEHDQDGLGYGPVGLRLGLPNDERRLRRWQWLKDHGVVVVRSRGHLELTELYREEDAASADIRLQNIGIESSHALPRTIPSAWAGALEGFYNRPIEGLADTTLSVAFKKEGWGKTDLRYWAAASRVKYLSDFSDIDREAWSVDIIELGSPGSYTDEIYRLIYFASNHRLSRGKSNNRDNMLASAFLKTIGLEVVRVDDFIRMFGIVERNPVS